MANKGTSYITDPNGIPITDENSVTRTTSEWTSGQVYTYDTLADAQADASLVAGSRIVVLGNTSAFDGGGAKLDVIASGGEIELTESGLTANRVDPRVVSRPSIESLLDVATYDGLTVRVDAYHSSYPSSRLLGGGTFRFNASLAKINHNGGTVISTTVPWDWSDNGEAFLSGTNDTDPSGNGCWVRCGTDFFSPLLFGAKPGLSFDSTASIHASLDIYFSDMNTHYVYDGGGYVFMVSSQYLRATQVYRKHIKNLYVQAGSGFSGEALISFAGATGNLNELRFTDCTFRGGSGQASAANVDKLVVLDSTQGVWFVGCEFSIASVACLEDLKASAGCEVYVINCRISGASQYNTEVDGIRFNGNDSAIINSVIRGCARHLYITNAGHQILGNHFYNYSGEIDTYSCVFTTAQQLVIVGNYFDSGRIRFESPKNIVLNSNRFLLPDSDEWSGIDAFVSFKSLSDGSAITNVSAIGNTFRKISGSFPVRGFTADQTSNTFDASLFDNNFIKGNTYEGVIESTTHPTFKITANNSSILSTSMGDKRPFGTSLTGQFKTILRATPNGTTTNADPVSVRAYTDGVTAFIELSAAITGHVSVEASTNASE